MLSGKKRNAREFDESAPPKKRAKVDNNADCDDSKSTKSPSLCESWPKKQPKLSQKQLQQMPSILSPNFYKVIFELFWNKKKFGPFAIEYHENKNSTNSKSKSFQCIMTFTNKSNKSQTITVSSSNFASKKKATIDAYRQFLYQYIPFQQLINRLKQFSFRNNLNLQQIVNHKGEHLKNKTNTIVIEPLPLNTNEVDVKYKIIHRTLKSSKLSKQEKKDPIIKFMEFERDSNKSIFQRGFVEFMNESLATKFVESLNNKSYENHRLSVTWIKDRNNSQSFDKKSFYLKCVGFPVDIQKNKVLQFLYKHKIEPKNSNLIFKYSLIAQVFLKFKSIRDCVEAFQVLNKTKYDGDKQNDKGKKYQLFARYSNEEEFNESVEYRKNISNIASMFTFDDKLIIFDF